MRRKVEDILKELSVSERFLVISKLFVILIGRKIKRALLRNRFHWIGKYRRQRLYKRSLLVVIFFGGMATLELRQYMLWAVMWGGTLSIFLNLYAFYQFVSGSDQ